VSGSRRCEQEQGIRAGVGAGNWRRELE